MTMPEKPKYLLVDSSVAPEVFVRVVKAKKLLAQGKVKSSSQAARMAGISRSAYYKYKDYIHRYDEHLQGSITTLSVTLQDEPGVLSSLLTQLYQAGANVITVNQNIPVDSAALVSIALKLDTQTTSLEELIERVSQIEGVIKLSTV